MNEHFYIDQKQTHCQSILHIKILIKNSHFINCINILNVIVFKGEQFYLL